MLPHPSGSSALLMNAWHTSTVRQRAVYRNISDVHRPKQPMFYRWALLRVTKVTGSGPNVASTQTRMNCRRTMMAMMTAVFPEMRNGTTSRTRYGTRLNALVELTVLCTSLFRLRFDVDFVAGVVARTLFSMFLLTLLTVPSTSLSRRVVANMSMSPNTVTVMSPMFSLWLLLVSASISVSLRMYRTVRTASVTGPMVALVTARSSSHTLVPHLVGAPSRLVMRLLLMLDFTEPRTLMTKLITCGSLLIG